jgi:exonuclease III
MDSKNLLIWNVCSLNAKAHRDALWELVVSEHPSLICLQETKLVVISHFDVVQMLVSGFDYTYLLVVQTRGGVLVAWRVSSWSSLAIDTHAFSVSVHFKHGSNEAWWFTGVYSLARDSDKPSVLQELHALRQVRDGAWLIIKDFNMIYRAEDKNNNQLDRMFMCLFRHWLSVAALKEIHLNRRLFTWSNKRSHPTLERIDRAFISNGSEDLFPNHDLHSLASLCSDHAPCCSGWMVPSCTRGGFHFRSFWLRFPGFAEMVSQAWPYPLRDANPFRRLDWLFCNIACVVTSWSACSIGNMRVQLVVAKEVLCQLKVAHDHRSLAGHEEDLYCMMKLKTLGLSSLQRTIAWQESHILWLSEGDTPTKFFHVHASARSRNKFIRSLNHRGRIMLDEEYRADAAFDFFNEVLVFWRVDNTSSTWRPCSSPSLTWTR